MGKWVLHTETKGTGAQMVPLESVEKRSTPVEPVFVPRKPAPRPQSLEPEPKAPRRFRVVDLMTREELADDASAHEAVDVLKDLRSMMDVTVYVWQDKHERWRPLTFGEQRVMWDVAHPKAAIGDH
jgi:hypothetical protein